MARQKYVRISTFLLSATVSFVVSLTAASAQSVPATAREAAKLPQYASRLANAAAAQQGSPGSSTAQRRAAMGGRADRSGLMSGLWRNYAPVNGVLYDNGPINGTTDAWTINFGFVTTDSFPGSGQATGLSFGAWLFPGDVLQSVEVSIGSAPFSNDISDQVVNFSQSSCSGNQYGFNVCVESGNLAAVNLNGGTYWVSLQNAMVNSGDPVYWDENSGPSMAEQSSVGTIPSEAFTISGNNTGPPECFQSQGNLQIIHSFTLSERGGGGGVVLDQAGNLYGTSYPAGDNNQGLAYKLNRFADWLLDPLFSFLGGSSGYQPNGVIVGPNGGLYGGAHGDIQNCGSDGSQYCGLVYNLTPQPTTCANAACGWREKVLYRFSSENDGGAFVDVSAYDRNGNLYGVTGTGGALDAGTVFELTPSGGGWTKNTLYSFAGGTDGANPNTVLVGNDGNLYGTATDGGASGHGVVFQLTPSGGGWTESVIHDFVDLNMGFPRYLVQDSTGNLYGIIGFGTDGAPPPAIFTLQKNGSGWVYSQQTISHDAVIENLNNLVSDAAGNLYGTGTYTNNFFGPKLSGLNRSGGYIFKASYNGSGWHYQEPELLNNTIFESVGSLAVDSGGILYGTTDVCGANGDGTVWQLTP